MPSCSPGERARTGGSSGVAGTPPNFSATGSTGRSASARLGWRAGGALSAASSVILLIGVIVVSDSAQYYTGRAFGRRPLAPSISPKKTLEGAIGGMVFGTIAMAISGFLLWLFWRNLEKESAEGGVETRVSTFVLLVALVVVLLSLSFIVYSLA